MIVKIGRPPGNAGRVPREENDMLPGAAAGLEHVACLAAQEFFENRPDRDMVAVKRCRVEPFIGGSTPAVVAEFTVVGHGRIAFIPRGILQDRWSGHHSSLPDIQYNADGIVDALSDPDLTCGP